MSNRPASRGMSRRELLRRACGVSLGALGLALVGCGEGDEQSAQAEQHAAEWDYAGEAGPERWAELNSGFALCGEGGSQSPIDISSAEPFDGPTLEFDYTVESERIVHLGHAVQAVFPPGAELRHGERVWRLSQLHYHTPSEHTIDGQEAAMELHLVHTADDGAVAVVGLLYDTYDCDCPDAVPEPAIQQIIDAAPAPGGTAEFALLSGDFAPNRVGFYRYSGSFTTPPCTEQIDWFLIRERRLITVQQLSALSALTRGDNNRPVQPRNGRTVGVLG